MDTAPLDAQELSEVSRWSGHASSPHKLAEVLSLLLPLLPLDCRARAACVCRAWRAATAHPALWEELSFERCAARVDNATLAALCARAGATLRTLDLKGGACARVTSYGMLAALRDGGCTGLKRLSTPFGLDNVSACTSLTAEQVQQLGSACPMLQHAACSVDCSLLDAVAVSTALPGPLSLFCSGNHEGLTQLAECLRVNAALTRLDLSNTDVGTEGATQLAECLRVNATLTSLTLGINNIGDEGATQVAECLRVNATLTSLDLSENDIGAAGARQLAECLRVNGTLASLDLSDNGISDVGATQLAECLRANATLTRMDLRDSGIGNAGATELAECLRINATLTRLDLSNNRIGAAGATQLA